MFWISLLSMIRATTLGVFRTVSEVFREKKFWRLVIFSKFGLNSQNPAYIIIWSYQLQKIFFSHFSQKFNFLTSKIRKFLFALLTAANFQYFLLKFTICQFSSSPNEDCRNRHSGLKLLNKPKMSQIKVLANKLVKQILNTL